MAAIFDVMVHGIVLEVLGHNWIKTKILLPFETLIIGIQQWENSDLVRLVSIKDCLLIRS